MDKKEAFPSSRDLTSSAAQSPFQREKEAALRAMEKKLKKAQNTVAGRQETLLSCQRWGDVYHEGMLLQANLFQLKKGMKEITVSDWENEGKERVLHLNPLVLPKDHLAAVFRRSRKLRLGETHAERMLKEAQDALSVLTAQQHALKSIESPEAWDLFCAQNGIRLGARQALPSAKKPPTPAKPYHQFVSQSGMEIWVGKSAANNDRLTFHCANGLDFWMHAHDHPGSHVVIRAHHGLKPDDETLLDAAELAARYSKAKHLHEGEVCLTQVKGIRPVKGCPGKVMVSKPKILRIRLDEARWMRLKATKR